MSVVLVAPGCVSRTDFKPVDESTGQQQGDHAFRLSAPDNVTAVLSAEGITINWTEVEGATHYDILWDTQAGRLGNVLTTERPPYEHRGLTGGTYYYSVRARSNDAVGALSAETVVIVPVQPPAQPQNVQGSPGDASAVISWDSVSGADNYTVYYNEGATVVMATASTSSTASTSTTINGLTNFTVYTFLVVAHSGALTSTPSATVQVTPLDPPAAPTATTSPGNQAVSLQWNSVAFATDYKVYWSPSPGVDPATTPPQRIENVATTTFNHLFLEAGRTYYYVVTATNPSGESAPSPEVSEMAGGVIRILSHPLGVIPDNTGVPANCNAPSGLAATIEVVDPVTIEELFVEVDIDHTWIADLHLLLETPGGLCIELCRSDGGSSDVIVARFDDNAPTPIDGQPAEILGTFSPETALGVAQGTSAAGIWTLHIHDADQDDLGILNVWGLSFRVGPLVPPNEPQFPEATALNNAVAVTWDRDNVATSYTVYWDTTPGFALGTANTVVVSYPGFMHTGIAPGTTYYYRVAAENAQGTSSVGPEVSAEPVSIAALMIDSGNFSFHEVNNPGFPTQGATTSTFMLDNVYSAVAVILYQTPLFPPFAVEFEYMVFDDDAGPLDSTADGFVLMVLKDASAYSAPPPGGKARGFHMDGTGYGLHLPLYLRRSGLIANGNLERLDYTLDDSVYSNGAWRTVQGIVSADRLTMFYEGNAIAQIVEPLDTTFGTVGFGASTGTADAEHQLRNVRIHVP